MAYARQPDAPDIPKTPLEALEPRPEEVYGIFQIYGYPAAGLIAGVLGPTLTNYYNRVPLYAGFWKHILFGISLAYVGIFIRDLRQEVMDDKDAVLRQYIQQHPDRFPPFKRVLYRDVFGKWEPNR